MGIRMTPDEQRAFLEGGHTAIITTIRKDGRPSSVPLWYVMLDGTMYLGTPPHAAKVGHLRRDPRCCILVETGEKWRELRAVQIQAEAVPCSPEEARAADAESHRKYETFRTPAEQMPASAQAAYSAQPVWYRIEPIGDAVSWDNSKLRLREPAG